MLFYNKRRYCFTNKITNFPKHVVCSWYNLSNSLVNRFTTTFPTILQNISRIWRQTGFYYSQVSIINAGGCRRNSVSPRFWVTKLITIVMVITSMSPSRQNPISSRNCQSCQSVVTWSSTAERARFHCCAAVYGCF